MNIMLALKQEEAKLHKQLVAVQGAIAALNGGRKTVSSPRRASTPNGTHAKRTMSAAVRAKLSRKAKERWAKIRAERAKKAK
jgi:hypothetical protein